MVVMLMACDPVAVSGELVISDHVVLDLSLSVSDPTLVIFEVNTHFITDDTKTSVIS